MINKVLLATFKEYVERAVSKQQGLNAHADIFEHLMTSTNHAG
jgi:hypothetical protein